MLKLFKRKRLTSARRDDDGMFVSINDFDSKEPSTDIPKAKDTETDEDSRNEDPKSEDPDAIRKTGRNLKVPPFDHANTPPVEDNHECDGLRGYSYKKRVNALKEFDYRQIDTIKHPIDIIELGHKVVKKNGP